MALDARAEGDVVAAPSARETAPIPGTPRARSGPGRRGGPPSILRLPAVGCSKPATMLSRVDLPQPEGPSSATNSPSPTVEIDAGERRHRIAPGVDLLDAAQLDGGGGGLHARALIHARVSASAARAPGPAASAGRTGSPPGRSTPCRPAPRPCGRRSRRPTARSPGPTSPRRSRPR